MARIDDGFATTISFASDSDVQFWEKEVTPPGLEAGGMIDTTTMRNTTWRTRNPKALKTLSDASFVAAYDPVFYDEVLLMLGVNQLITVTFPNGDTIAFWGWIDVFTPNRNVEGEQPTAAVTLIPSNQDASGDEIAPNFTAA